MKTNIKDITSKFILWIQRYHPRHLSILPFFIQKYFIVNYEKKSIGNLNLPVNKNLKLKQIDWNEINTILNKKSYEHEWNLLVEKFNKLNINFGEASANPGDQRVIYHLIKYFKPVNILEIGTHTGSSCAVISSAIMENLSYNPALKSSFDTVDILDVNSDSLKNWVKYDCPKSPIENLKNLKLIDFCNFNISDSVDFLKNSKKKYDFIFLDGDHSALVAYKEIIESLKIINDDSIILMHDFYPEYKNIFKNNVVIPGPFAAFQKIKKEIDNIKYIPFKNLPWKTKNKSRTSSLALITQK